jgi:hypothetical protein
MQKEIPEFGFIITRYINSHQSGEYWIHSYNSIRKYYKEPILIIDDNSNQNLIKQINLENCTVIQSEFPKVGEALAYYYFHMMHPFKKAICIHDSVFINKYIDFSTEENKFLWYFNIHAYDNVPVILKIFDKLNRKEELKRYYENQNLWNGCFGGMSIITWEVINSIAQKYNLTSLIKSIKDREDRMGFERVWAVIMFQECNLIKGKESLFGDIYQYSWGVSFDDYIQGKLNHLPIIKIWTGR